MSLYLYLLFKGCEDINSGLVFSCRQSKLDENGQYIFLFCAIESSVLANVYIPPPFSTEIMCDLIRFIADKPGVPVIVAGIFNRTMNNSIDRFPPRVSLGGASSGPLF